MTTFQPSNSYRCLITLSQLEVGDVMIGTQGTSEEVRLVVQSVECIGGRYVIDFTDGKSTAPLPNAKVTVERLH